MQKSIFVGAWFNEFIINDYIFLVMWYYFQIINLVKYVSLFKIRRTV